MWEISMKQLKIIHHQGLSNMNLSKPLSFQPAVCYIFMLNVVLGCVFSAPILTLHGITWRLLRWNPMQSLVATVCSHHLKSTNCSSSSWFQPTWTFYSNWIISPKYRCKWNMFETTHQKIPNLSILSLHSPPQRKLASTLALTLGEVLPPSQSSGCRGRNLLRLKHEKNDRKWQLGTDGCWWLETIPWKKTEGRAKSHVHHPKDT